MAKTFLDLQNFTRTYLDEVAPADWTSTEVNYAINMAYHDTVTRVVDIYEQYYETTTPFAYAVVANQQEYLIDSSLIKITRVEINYAPQQANSGPLRAIPVKMDEDLLNITNSAAQGAIFNAGYYIHGNQIAQYMGFIPMPTQSDTTGKSISVWGIATPPDLVLTTDIVNIPYVDTYWQYVALKAAGILLSKGQQSEAAASAYLQRYEVGMQQMQTFIKERQADGVLMIVDVELDNLDFSTMPPF